MLRRGQLVWNNSALEGWRAKDVMLEPGQETDTLSPGERLHVMTWQIVPAWSPIVVLGPPTVSSGKDCYPVDIMGRGVIYIWSRDLEVHALTEYGRGP